jgi:ankyrin repeat protein
MGVTALMGAANRGSDEIIKYLVSKGAKLDVKDAEGRTAMTWAEGRVPGHESRAGQASSIDCSTREERRSQEATVR